MHFYSLTCGYACLPNGFKFPVTWMDLDMPALGENMDPPDNYALNFKAGNVES